MNFSNSCPQMPHDPDRTEKLPFLLILKRFIFLIIY